MHVADPLGQRWVQLIPLKFEINCILLSAGYWLVYFNGFENLN